MMMKKKTPVASVARGAGIALGLGLVVAGPLTGDTPPRYDIPYSMEVETPHVTWARSAASSSLPSRAGATWWSSWSGSPSSRGR
jgi:hypothetical protein